MITIPKPASTVVLMDHMARVLLTKRPMTMKFMGGFYVFPGGSVDLKDNIEEREYIKYPKQSDSFSYAHYIAAARELFEEVGVLLCCKADGFPIQFKKETEIAYRRLLVNDEISFIQMLKQEGLYFNPENLTYFGHRITPESQTFRFDTRFFLAKLPKGQSAKADMNEVDEILWITPQKALEAYEKGTMLLAEPTVSSLSAIINHQKGASLMMTKQRDSL